ncbi:hypothetical protein L9G15_19180 [Shewanella sp. A3A]|nr:hypothetical protein [Shewanella ferrihydritica]
MEQVIKLTLNSYIQESGQLKYDNKKPCSTPLSAKCMTKKWQMFSESFAIAANSRRFIVVSGSNAVSQKLSAKKPPERTSLVPLV